MLEDYNKCSGINCKVFFKSAVGWLVTCVIVALTTSLFISQGIYAPTVYNRCDNSTNIFIYKKKNNLTHNTNYLL